MLKAEGHAQRDTGVAVFVVAAELTPSLGRRRLMEVFRNKEQIGNRGVGVGVLQPDVSIQFWRYFRQFEHEHLDAIVVDIWSWLERILSQEESPLLGSEDRRTLAELYRMIQE